jgi:hypothetical protein
MNDHSADRTSRRKLGLRFQISLRNLMLVFLWVSFCGGAIACLGKLLRMPLTSPSSWSSKSMWITALWLAAFLTVWSPVLAIGALINRMKVTVLMGVSVAVIACALTHLMLQQMLR